MIEPAFKTIDPQDILVNPFKLMLKDWMLVTAGTIDDYNTMTAGWGGLGGMWGKNAAMCVIRPTRHTLQFIEREDNFTFCFFDDQYREALQFCGSKSGRDIPDKAVQAGLTPIAGGLDRTVVFAEAQLILECRKMYWQDIDPANFLDPKIHDWYPAKDYHRMYIGEIVNCRTKE